MSRTRENRLRRMAARQALALHGSRARDPHSLVYRRYWLDSTETGKAVFGIDVAGRPCATLDEIEAFLTKKGPRDE